MLVHSLPGRSEVDIMKHLVHLAWHTLLPGHDVAWHILLQIGIKSLWAAACNAVCYIFNAALLYTLMYLGLERANCGVPYSLQLCTAVCS